MSLDPESVDTSVTQGTWYAGMCLSLWPVKEPSDACELWCPGLLQKTSGRDGTCWLSLVEVGRGCLPFLPHIQVLNPKSLDHVLVCFVAVIKRSDQKQLGFALSDSSRSQSITEESQGRNLEDAVYGLTLQLAH